MIDSAFSMFSSIIDSENVWLGEETAGELVNEEEEEEEEEVGVLEDENKRGDNPFLGMRVLFFEVSANTIFAFQATKKTAGLNLEKKREIEGS